MVGSGWVTIPTICSDICHMHLRASELSEGTLYTTMLYVKKFSNVVIKHSIETTQNEPLKDRHSRKALSKAPLLIVLKYILQTKHAQFTTKHIF